MFIGHAYMLGGREPRWESTVAEQCAHNPHLQAMDRAAFIGLRNERDPSLPLLAPMPTAFQINARGRLLEPEDNGTAYLKISLS